VPDRGVLFYNVGPSCLPRLAIAMSTCRAYYDGPITLLQVGTAGAEDAGEIAAAYQADVKPVKFDIPPGRNMALLGKTLIHTVTPYDVSVFLDADTFTLRPFAELFDFAERHEFTVPELADWTAHRIRGRIFQWKGLVPRPMLLAAASMQRMTINTGVFAFRRDSQLQAAVYEHAVKARHLFIPDEIAVQILMAKYPSHTAPHQFNESCKFGKPDDPDVRIIHFHGRKHCRIAGPYCRFRRQLDKYPHKDVGEYRILYAAEKWLPAFERLRAWGPVARNIQHDRQLCKYLPCWDAVKGQLNA